MKDNNIVRVAVIGMTENKGGMESVIMNIYRNIDRTKIQFDFLLPHHSKTMAYEDEVLQMGGGIFRIIYSQRESFFKSRNCFLDYFRTHPEVKVVHLHTNFPYGFPLKMAKKAGIPVRIIHAHNSVLLFGNKTGFTNRIKSLRNFISYNQIKKFSNVYFSCSDLAAKSTFKNNDYIWIKNGIDLNRYIFNRTVRESLREQYDIAPHEKLIGFVGRLCDQKNPLFALNIFNEYIKINPDAKMVYIGEGEMKKLIEQKVIEYGLEGKVSMLGMISNVEQWYQAFDLFLLPSLFEGLPVVLVEAQTAGLPCLVSDTITTQINVTTLINYKSNKISPKEWAMNIEDILKKENNRENYVDEMKKAGFDVKSMAKEVMTYYLMSKK